MSIYDNEREATDSSRCISMCAVEKARVIDPFGHAGFDPSGNIRLTI